MNTVLIPTYNESQNPLFDKLLATLKIEQNLQCLFIDGGSTDQTRALIERHSFVVLLAPRTNRAMRFNIGLAHASGAMILLHHPRSVLSSEGLHYFSQLQNAASWGGFTHSFDDDNPLLKFTSWYSNQVRARRGIIYLDHCIVAPRQWLLDIGGVPEVDIFEDTLLSRALRRIARPQILPFKVTTSALRFKKNGYMKQALLNQYLKCQFYLRSDYARMNKHYEKGLELNS